MIDHSEDFDFIHDVVDLFELDDFGFLQNFHGSKLSSSLVFSDPDPSERTLVTKSLYQFQEFAQDHIH